MKRLLFMLAIGVGLAGSIEAAPIVLDAPIRDSGTPVTIAISSTTLTKLPTSQTSGRVGVYVDNPSSAGNADVSGFFGNCTSTALASTIRPIVISTAAVTTDYFPMREDVCLWLISLQTGSASINVHYQEVIK
jgi:hypothetical protein